MADESKTKEGTRGTKETKESFERFKNPMQDYIDKHFFYYSNLDVVKPHNAIMVSSFKDHHEKHLAFKCKSTDVFVASFLKAGTTWTQELVWCLVRGMNHKLKDKTLMERFPQLEFDSVVSPIIYGQLIALPEDDHERPGGQMKIIERQEDPRLVKTHLFRQLLPRDVTKHRSKIVYVMRDPRDVCVSFYFHSKKFTNYTGDFNSFVQMFLLDAFGYGPVWGHVLSYWNSRHSDNILFIRYEDMIKNLRSVILKVASFLDIKPTEEHMKAMLQHLSFKEMKHNSATNNEAIMKRFRFPSDIEFMRKGVIGDYKTYMNTEQINQFKEWTEKWLKDSDFPYYRDGNSAVKASL